ncbi:MAG: chloramphenicol acetyltransferase [Pedobacter sp.]|nr:MAG: chloramphenicol acetyltransferase [Pedobacter sp.]
MKKLLDVANWNRKDHFAFFNTFEEPFFGVTVNMDCTIAYQKAKQLGVSFFQYYLHKSLVAANRVEAFRYRIIDGQVWVYDKVNASAVINRPDGTFGFSYITFEEKFNEFSKGASIEIEKVRQSSGLKFAESGENVIHCSALPTIDFTALSHARNYSFKDSCPKFSFGQLKIRGNQKLMALSVHVNHALMDGFHVGEFIKIYQDLLNHKEA